MYTELLTKDTRCPFKRAGTRHICENAFADAVCTELGNAGMNDSKPYAFIRLPHELESITQRSFHVAIALPIALRRGGFIDERSIAASL
jgi:hypothetical protein